MHTPYLVHRVCCLQRAMALIQNSTRKGCRKFMDIILRLSQDMLSTAGAQRSSGERLLQLPDLVFHAGCSFHSRLPHRGQARYPNSLTSTSLYHWIHPDVPGRSLPRQPKRLAPCVRGIGQIEASDAAQNALQGKGAGQMDFGWHCNFCHC